MQHILKLDEESLHDRDEYSAKCKCNPKVILDKKSGDMFVIHNNFKGLNITDDDVKGLLAFINDDPEYEGGDLIICPE